MLPLRGFWGNLLFSSQGLTPLVENWHELSPLWGLNENGIIFPRV